MTTDTMPPNPTKDGDYRRLPEFVGVEADSYVFVAVLEDPSLDGRPNWLMQTFRVDPTDGDPDHLLAEVTERYHVDGRENDIAFEERYTVELAATGVAEPPRVESVARVLERWYRHNYPGDFDTHSDTVTD
jgi:hypothetical protein